MIVLPQKIKVKWHSNNKSYYISKGYLFTKIGDEFEVNVFDVKSNYYIIEIKCDYCDNYDFVSFGSTTLSKKYKKDCCNNCFQIRKQETNIRLYGTPCTLQNKDVKEKSVMTMIDKYGVDNPSKSKEIREKTITTNIKKYGCKYGIQSDIVRDKVKKTNLEKYGVEHNFQIEEVKENRKLTFLEKYGVKYITQNEEIKQKIVNTNLRKYGVKYFFQSDICKNKTREFNLKKYGFNHPMKNPIIRASRLSTSLQTKHDNGTTISSAQQRYIYSILGGELNFPIDRCLLDIAFVDEKIYIEYDGSGHELSVKLGCSKDKFEELQKNRFYFLKNLGWKLIRIKSKKDLLPSNEIIFNLIQQAKEYLNSGHSWFEINIDDSKIICSQFKKDIMLSGLRNVRFKS